MTDHPALAGLEALLAESRHHWHIENPDDEDGYMIEQGECVDLDDLRTALATAREALGEMEVREEWGVRFGDGEVDSMEIVEDSQSRGWTRDKAAAWLADCKRAISNGADPADYEPMTLVQRTRTVIPAVDHVSPWREA